MDPGDAGVLVSDEERDRAASEIREHFAAGRLNADELSDRLSAVYAARTEGQLRAARANLPDLPVSRQAQRAELAARRSELSRRLIQRSGAGLTPFLICTVIWFATGASGIFWPIFALLIVLIPLVEGAWHLYGPAPDLDHVERQITGRSPRRDRHHGRRNRPPGGLR